jgi:RsiW-degrading membrane proteinase PrsW (M82 family)
MNAALVVWTFVPSILWLSWLLKRDKHQPEPSQLIALAFSLGMLIVLPAGIVNDTVLNSQGFENLFQGQEPGTETWTGGLIGRLVASFGVVAPTEELLKFSIVYYFFFRHKEFDEPIDGIIYAGSVALGFATAENFLYVQRFGGEVLLVRGLLTVPAHFLFAASYGYAMGIKQGLPSRPTGLVSGAKVDGGIPNPNRGPSLRRGVLIAIAAHGFYDFSVFTGDALNQPILAWTGVFTVMTLLVIRWKSQVGKLDSHSQFKPNASQRDFR